MVLILAASLANQVRVYDSVPGQCAPLAPLTGSEVDASRAEGERDVAIIDLPYGWTDFFIKYRIDPVSENGPYRCWWRFIDPDGATLDGFPETHVTVMPSAEDPEYAAGNFIGGTPPAGTRLKLSIAPRTASAPDVSTPYDYTWHFSGRFVGMCGNIPPPSIPEFGDEITAGFLTTGMVKAGTQPVPVGGWSQFIVDYTLIDPALQGGFYVAYLLEDADHQGIRYSTGQLMVNLTNGQHEIRNNSSAWTPEELASARYISVWGMPTGLDPQNTTTNYTFTPRISVSFVAPPNTVTPPPPGGDWTAYDYDDSSWQFPATTSVAISAPPAPLPPFILPETQSVTHALALFPNAAIGERVFYRHKFTLPAGDIVSALLDAHVEDATPIGVYVNGTMLAYSSVIDPSVGDIYNRMNLAVPLELLHTPTVVRYPIDFTCTFTSGCNEIVQMFPVAGRIPTHMHTHLDAPVELEISGGIGLLCSLRAIDGPAGGGIVIQANVLVGETDATNTSTLTIDDAATTAGIYVYGVGDGVTPTHITGYTDITYADTAENILALCVENTSGSALETSYRLEITTGEVPPIGGCVPVNEFGGDTLGSFDDNYQLAGRALCTSGWTGFTSIVERGSDGTAGDAYLSFVFEGADQEPVNPSFGKGFFTATLPAGGTATPYTNFEFSTPEDRDAIRYVSLWTRPTGTSPQSPSTDYPIAASLSLTFNGCGPATSAQHPQVVWVM